MDQIVLFRLGLRWNSGCTLTRQGLTEPDASDGPTTAHRRGRGRGNPARSAGGLSRAAELSGQRRFERRGVAPVGRSRVSGACTAGYWITGRGRLRPRALAPRAYRAP